MDITALLKLVTLVSQLSASLPDLIASLKGTLSSEDERALKTLLAEQRTKNDADYAKAQALLTGIAQG